LGGGGGKQKGEWPLDRIVYGGKVCRGGEKKGRNPRKNCIKAGRWGKRWFKRSRGRGQRKSRPLGKGKPTWNTKKVGAEIQKEGLGGGEYFALVWSMEMRPRRRVGNVGYLKSCNCWLLTEAGQERPSSGATSPVKTKGIGAHGGEGGLCSRMREKIRILD